MGVGTDVGYAQAEAQTAQPKQDGKQLSVTLKVAEGTNISDLLKKLEDVGEVTGLNLYPNMIY